MSLNELALNVRISDANFALFYLDLDFFCLDPLLCVLFLAVCSSLLCTATSHFLFYICGAKINGYNMVQFNNSYGPFGQQPKSLFNYPVFVSVCCA